MAQLALAKQFREGDFRSGYYRDQTLMFAIGESDIEKFFAQLYATPSLEDEPASAGRSMNGHFATRNLNDDGSWKDLTRQKNSSADISPTAGQMPRLVGLAWASKLYRNNPGLQAVKGFSVNGNEVAFGTIGDASTSEGLFSNPSMLPAFYRSQWRSAFGTMAMASRYRRSTRPRNRTFRKSSGV